jgi:hypothetical protein
MLIGKVGIAFAGKMWYYERVLINLIRIVIITPE